MPRHWSERTPTRAVMARYETAARDRESAEEGRGLPQRSKGQAKTLDGESIMIQQQPRARGHISIQHQPKVAWDSMTEAERMRHGAAINCACCGGAGTVELVSNRRVYGGKPFGAWPWAYLCHDCGAYVGLHANTLRAIGTLADGDTRDARRRAHAAFDPLWKSKDKRRPALFQKRSDAYYWLSLMLQIPFDECHISWFGVDLCDRTVMKCEQLLREYPAS